MTAADSEFGVYDFGLSPDDEARAARLQAECVVVDMLFQGPCGYRSFDDGMLRTVEEQWEVDRDPVRAWNFVVELPARLAARGELADFEACWRGSGITGGTRERDFLSLEDVIGGFAVAQLQFDRLPWLDKALRADDVRKAKAAGRMAGWVNSQDTLAFGRDLGLVEWAWELGLRMLQLTYNSQNLVGSGCTERVDGGITSFGKRLIAKLNELGVVIDTSHCGRQTTLDTCTLSEVPVIASHTSAAGLYAVDRAKTDEELEALAATGGVIGVYAPPFFLSPDPDVSIEAMLDHVDYLVQLVGAEHVGIGTDWPLQMPKWALETITLPWAATAGFRPEHRLDPVRNLVGFDDYRDFPNITRGLVARGYSDADVAAILGGNFLRVWDAVAGLSA